MPSTSSGGKVEERCKIDRITRYLDSNAKIILGQSTDICIYVLQKKETTSSSLKSTPLLDLQFTHSNIKLYLFIYL